MDSRSFDSSVISSYRNWGWRGSRQVNAQSEIGELLHDFHIIGKRLNRSISEVVGQSRLVLLFKRGQAQPVICFAEFRVLLDGFLIVESSLQRTTCIKEFVPFG